MDQKLKILILEDDPNDRDLLLYNLKKSGIDFVSEVVFTEEDFTSGLINFDPDIILSDFALPAFNGMDAFKIKQNLAVDIPFIIVSGTLGEERAVELIKSGVTDYVVKACLSSLLKLRAPCARQRIKWPNTRLRKKSSSSMPNLKNALNKELPNWN